LGKSFQFIQQVENGGEYFFGEGSEFVVGRGISGDEVNNDSFEYVDHESGVIVFELVHLEYVGLDEHDSLLGGLTD
jgi:hypothetical protein